MIKEEMRLKKIVPAGLFHRTFAAVLDLIMIIFVGLSLFIGISEIMIRTKWVQSYKQDYIQVITDSGIAVYDEKEDVVNPYEYTNYKQYEAIFFDFYTDFINKATGDETIRDAYWYNVMVYGLDDILNMYSVEYIDSHRLGIATQFGESLFTYKLDGENKPLPNELALPICYENDPEHEETDSEKTALRKYYYATDEETENNELIKKHRYVYYYALSELTSLKRIKDDYYHYALYGRTLPLVIGVFLSMVIFYLVIPLFFKDGETLGKKINKICLVNKLGYQYKRAQLFPRVAFPILLSSIIIFFTGFSIITFVILSVVILASFLLVIFTKEHKSIHDYLAGTLVIEKVDSTWFENATEEEQKEKEVQEYVDSIKNKEIEDDNPTIIYKPKEDNKDDKVGE